MSGSSCDSTAGLTSEEHEEDDSSNKASSSIEEYPNESLPEISNGWLNSIDDDDADLRVYDNMYRLPYTRKQCCLQQATFSSVDMKVENFNFWQQCCSTTTKTNL